MRNLFTLLLFCFTLFCTAQTKEELIKEIAKTNSFHDKQIGAASGIISPQYSNFKKLRGIITDEELEALTHHENAVVRLYAKQWMIKEGKGNPAQFFLEEIEKDEYVETFSGCILSDDKTYSIVYHKYWDKIRMEALEPFDYDSQEGKAAVTEVFKEDKIMQELDSIVLYSEKPLFWLLYVRAFENRKYDEKHLPHIKKLAFEKHNGYAFKYLFNYYMPQLKSEMDDYFNGEFLKHTFKSNDEVFYLNKILVLLLETKDKHYREIAVAKLKSDKSWEQRSAWFQNNIISYYNIEL